MTNNNTIDTLIKNKQYHKAIEKCIELYTSQSNDIIYFNYIVQTYTLYQNNNNNIVINAIQDLNKLLIYTPKVSSQFCVIHNQIGMYYFELNDHTNAIIHFKKVLTVKKDIPDVYNNIAVCHKLLKEYDKSIINLNISLQLQSNDNIYRRLGELNLITKQYDKSMNLFVIHLLKIYIICLLRIWPKNNSYMDINYMKIDYYLIIYALKQTKLRALNYHPFNIGMEPMSVNISLLYMNKE